MPTALRACLPASPSTSMSSSLAPLATCAWPVNPGALATKQVTLTIRVIASSPPTTEAAAARATAVQSLRRLLADLWHILAILYVASIYFVWALQIEGGFQFVLTATLLTVVILALARLLAVVSDRAIARGLSVGDDVKRLYPPLEARANRYLSIPNLVAKVGIPRVAAVAPPPC